MAKRRSISVPGLHHGKAPIPLASQVGPLLVSGGLLGMDPATGEIPSDLASQCTLVFANMQRVMDAAGGDTGDIVKMTVWVRDRSARALLNGPWEAMFPDPDSRPARHTFVYEGFNDPIQIQAEIVAYLT
jgi:enamine deaminase RidA (YjgF/YER057c/UK114 family)